MTTTHSATFCLALGASLLGLAAMPLLAQASLLQPPISAWSPAQPGANPASSTAASAVAPAPGAAAAAAAPTEAATAPVSVKRAPVAPVMQPGPAQRQNAVQRLLAFQADGKAAGAMQPISGPEAAASYKAWLRTFANQQQSSGKPAASGIGSMAQQLPSGAGSYGN